MSTILACITLKNAVEVLFCRLQHRCESKLVPWVQKSFDSKKSTQSHSQKQHDSTLLHVTQSTSHIPLIFPACVWPGHSPCSLATSYRSFHSQICSTKQWVGFLTCLQVENYITFSLDAFQQEVLLL